MTDTEGGKKKKILVPIFFRGHLARLRSVFRAIERDPRLELQIMVASRAAYGSFFTNLYHSEPRSLARAIRWYMRARLATMGADLGVWGRGYSGRDALERKVIDAGFPVHARLPLFLDGGTSRAMAKSVGIGMTRIVDELRRLQPDVILVNGDRFEMMAATIAAAYLNIRIAHHEGGDVSGTIDESVRHAITKFAQVHLAATECSRARIVQMGEDPRFVFTVGSPTIDALKETDLESHEGFPPGIDPAKPYLLAMLHPVTTEGDRANRATVESVLTVLERLQMPTVLVWGNSDAYSRMVGPVVAEWIETRRPPFLYTTKLMHSNVYARLLARAACAVGNSSSFLREGAYLGTPAVIVGNRQQGRERAENAMEVEPDAAQIEAAISAQLTHGKYAGSMLFGDGKAGKQIAEILATVDPPIQKRFHNFGP